MGLWRASRRLGHPVPAVQSGSVRRSLVAGAGWAAAAALGLLIGLGGIRLVGESLTGTPGGVLTQEEVARLLAAASAAPAPDPTSADDTETPPAETVDPRSPDEPAETVDPTTTPGTVNPVDPRTTSPTAAPTTTTPGRTPATTRPTTAAPVQRTFSTRGGTAIAACQGSLAYLVSWSPTQGYRVERARQGPDSEVEVRFEGTDGRSEIKIRCARGVPAAEIKEDD